MSRRSDVAVVGAGRWGMNLVRNHAAIGSLAAVVDPSPAARQRVREAFPGLAVHDEVAVVLDDPSIVGVVVATPAVTHGELAARALDAGKHVFVEKPLCLEIGEAEHLRDTAAARGLVLMVGHLLLYHPGFRRLRRLVTEGELGRLRYIYSNRLSFGRIRVEENALWSFAPHDVSMILALAGELPTDVAANGGQFVTPGIADTTLSYLRFPSGLEAHLFVSWLHPFKEQRLVVVGESGMAVFADTNAPNQKLLLYRNDVIWEGELPVAAAAGAEPVPFDDDEPLRLECEAFLDAIENGKTPPSSADEAVGVLAVLMACQRALVTGRPTPLAAA